MDAGVTRNEEIPQRKIEDHFSSSRYPSRSFSHKLVGDHRPRIKSS